jgi:histidinol-phosphatase (PHP family)
MPLSNHDIPLDYHVHSNISCDSRATMAEMCQAALARGITEIAFTEHFDLHPADICTGYYKPDQYFENLEAARRDFGPQGLTIRAGVELGEFHRYRAEQQAVLDAWPYDFVLGSLHWVGDESVFDVHYFSNRVPDDAAADYFTELAELARCGGFDVLAHPDVLKRTGATVYKTFDLDAWQDLIRPVWQVCIDNGIGIEINTAGLRGSVGATSPTLAALRWYREMGGKLLTIGSDSHKPEHMGLGLVVALDMAREAGFTHLCRFERRQVAGWIAI